MSTLQKQLIHYSVVPRGTLKFLGIYPDNKKLSKPRVALWFACALYSLYTTLYSTIISWPDAVEVAINTCAVIASIIVTCKFINFLVYRESFSKLLILIDEEFWVNNENSPPEEKQIILDYGKFCYMFTTFQLCSMFAASPLWLVEPFFQMKGLLPVYGNKTGLILPFEIWLFNIDTHAHPTYDILYAVQNFSTFINTTFIVASDSLFMLLCTSLCAQFRILQNRLRTFTEKESDEKRQEMYLIKCIQFHQDLCQYCMDVEYVETKIILVQFFISASFLCVSGIILSLYTDSIFTSTRNILFIIAASWELFVHCYGADLLTTECFLVSQAAYESNWFESSSAVKNIIHMIILRAQKPFHLTAWGFTPASVESFEMVIRTAVSYFTVFNSVKDKF